MVRHHVRGIEVDGDYVGALSDLKASGIWPALCHGSVDCSHLDDICRLHNGRVGMVAVVDHGCKMNLLEHVHVVVAGTSVGAQSHIDSPIQHLLHRSKPASELHVA